MLIQYNAHSSYYRLATGRELNIELEREPITEDIGMLFYCLFNLLITFQFIIVAHWS